MANLGNKFTQNSNLSRLRTPATPENKYKRLGLLFIGLACIIAGVIIWISAANSAENTSETETTVVETTVAE